MALHRKEQVHSQAKSNVIIYLKRNTKRDLVEFDARVHTHTQRERERERERS
jgi:hypothetical protein